MTKPSIDTKEQILNVAEKLFAENGFAGTSLRSVISEAEVNLSAVHYHFGSKEELFRAVVMRISQPVVEGELRLLAKLKEEKPDYTLEEVLTCFLTPPLQVILNSGDRKLYCARFMGRCRLEPYSVGIIAEEEFQESQTAYLDALQRVLPNQTRNEIHWQLDLVIASLIRVLTQAQKPHSLIQKKSIEEIDKVVSKLVNFLASGMNYRS